MRNQTFVCHADSVQGGMLSIQLRQAEPQRRRDDKRCRCPALPTGCLVEIFRHLDCYRSMAKCRAVCKDWRSAAADSGLHTRLCLRPDSRPHSRQRSTRSSEASAVLRQLSQLQLIDLELGTAPNRCASTRVVTSNVGLTAVLNANESRGQTQRLPTVSSLNIYPILLDMFFQI